MVVTPIKNRLRTKELTLCVWIMLMVCGCAPKQVEPQPTGPIKLKLDQPPTPEIINTQKGLPDNIFDERLEDTGLSATVFTSLYAEAIKAALPRSTVTVVAPLKLYIKADTDDLHPCKIDLTKLWLSCKDSPGHRESIVRTHIQNFYGLINFNTQPVAGQDSIDRIVPLLRNEKFVKELSANSPKSNPNDYHDKFLDDLYVVYAVDSAQAIQSLKRSFLNLQVHVTPDKLNAISKKNLERMVARDITLRQDGPIYIVTVGGNYEPSLILLDQVLQKLAGHVSGRLVVSFPTRDSLFICGDKTPGALEKLRAVTDKALAKTEDPISKELYVLDQGHWQIFKAFAQ